MSWIARIYNWVTDRDNGVPITASRMDAEFDNIITGLNNCITADGSNPPTANIGWGGFKITNLGSPSASTDAATKGYVDTALTRIHAYSNSPTSPTAAGSPQQYAITLETMDTLNEFTPSATIPQFVPGNTGYYWIGGFVTVLPSATSHVSLYTVVNGSVGKKYEFDNLQSGKYHSLQFGSMFSLTAADVIKFYLTTDNDLIWLDPDEADTSISAVEPRHVNGLDIFRLK